MCDRLYLAVLVGHELKTFHLEKCQFTALDTIVHFFIFFFSVTTKPAIATFGTSLQSIQKQLFIFSLVVCVVILNFLPLEVWKVVS